MKLDKVINFFKSKSVVDIVYLVMMILIVTIIKDMIVSMYRKRKDKQWLNQAFGKTKGKKNVEGFSTGAGWTTASTCVSPIDDTTSVCDRLKFLLCNTNFEKLKKLLDDVVSISNGNVTITTDSLKVSNLKGLSSDDNPISSYTDIHMKNNKGIVFHGPRTINNNTDIRQIVIRGNTITIPRVNTNTNEYINAIRFIPDDNQGDNKPHSLNITYFPWDGMHDQKRFQIRQVLKHKNTNWTDMYRKFTNNANNRNYGINPNGEDYNDGNDNTYRDFAKNPEGNDLNEFES